MRGSMRESMRRSMRESMRDPCKSCCEIFSRHNREGTVVHHFRANHYEGRPEGD